MLRNLGQSPKLNSKYETRDMRRFLNCLDYNPQLITLFLKAMSTGQLPNMEEEETILSLIRAVISYYEAAPRAERESPTPLRIAATLSQGECWLMSFIGASGYSDIDVYHRQIETCIKGAITKLQKLRTRYGTPGEPPSSSETGLRYLLDDILTQRAHNKNVKRLIGNENWGELLDEVKENNLFATAVRGGLKVKPYARDTVA